jgi:hypothetical protein
MRIKALRKRFELWGAGGVDFNDDIRLIGVRSYSWLDYLLGNVVLARPWKLFIQVFLKGDLSKAGSSKRRTTLQRFWFFYCIMSRAWELLLLWQFSKLSLACEDKCHLNNFINLSYMLRLIYQDCLNRVLVN